MKVKVYAVYRTEETFEIEVDDESEIRDKAWDCSWEFGDTENVSWEIIEESDSE